jgi:hypothetical protein
MYTLVEYYSCDPAGMRIRRMGRGGRKKKKGKVNLKIIPNSFLFLPLYFSPSPSPITKKKVQEGKVALYSHCSCILTSLLSDSGASSVFHFDLILYVRPRGTSHYFS